MNRYAKTVGIENESDFFLIMREMDDVYLDHAKDSASRK